MKSIRQSLSRLIGAGVVACVLTGCSALNLQEPSASLRGVSIPNVSAEGMTVNFDVAVENPNGFSIPLSQADYKLALGGVQVLDDKANPSASIPSKGSLPVTIPVRLSFQQLLSAEQALAKSGGNIPYKLDGALAFTASKLPLAPTVRAPLHFSGTLPIRDALQQVARDPSILNNPEARKLLTSLFGNAGGILGEILNRR